MKKYLLSTVCFSALSMMMYAQPSLLGMTRQGGSAQAGTIISYTVAPNTLSALNSFDPIESSGSGKLMKASDGTLYGTNYNGRYGYGGIYSLDAVSSEYTNLFDFNGANGSNPTGLVQVNELLYGTTMDGGSSSKISQYGDGVLYAYNLQTNEYRKLVDFDDTKGARPTGLVLAGNGKLYGTTYSAGINNGGVLFSFDPATEVYEKIMVFDGTNGTHPTGSLCQAANGLLYGMTESGGKWNRGVIYAFNPLTNGLVKLVDFDGTNGTNPTSYASLVQGSNGKLYGMTYSGGSSNQGVLFSFDPITNECKSVRDFDGTGGSRPYSSVIQLNNGKLYGMTYSGGSSSYGVLFSFDPATNVYLKEKDFDGITGGNPLGDLVQANDGKLYATSSKNTVGHGNIFSFDLTSGTYEVRKTFGLNSTGSFASAGLLRASDGKFYGTTIEGGTTGFGVLFTFDAGSKTCTKLYEFNGADGSKPYGVLIQAADGKLYGMTNAGGSSDYGVIFSFDATTNTYQKLKDFDGVSGARPYSSLLQAANGKLYGLTTSGGNNNKGVLFVYDPGSNAYQKLKDFNGTEGLTLMEG